MSVSLVTELKCVRIEREYFCPPEKKKKKKKKLHFIISIDLECFMDGLT